MRRRGHGPRDVTKAELRRLATYLQHRLDSTARGDLKMRRELVGLLLFYVQIALKQARLEHGGD